MINVAIRHDERALQIIVSGHAEYAEKGQDIVCAGISTLTSTLANIVQSWADDDLIHMYMIWPDREPHHIYVETEGDKALNATLEAFVLQYCQFAGLYPQNVKVQFLERGDEDDRIFEQAAD